MNNISVIVLIALFILLALGAFVVMGLLDDYVTMLERLKRNGIEPPINYIEYCSFSVKMALKKYKKLKKEEEK